MTHIESRLRAQLLGQQGHGDLELHPAVGRALHVLEPLLQTHVPPDGLHHPQADGVEALLDPYGGDLVLHRAAHGLQPRHQALVPLQMPHHLPAAGGEGVPPVLPGAHHLDAAHVHALHVWGGGGGRRLALLRTRFFSSLVHLELHVNKGRGPNGAAGCPAG